MHTRVARDLRQRAGVAHDDWGTAGHRLNGGQAEAFVEGWHGEHVRSAIERREVSLRNEVQKAHGILDVVLLDGSEGLIIQPAFASRDSQHPRATWLTPCPRECGDQPRVVLARLD